MPEAGPERIVERGWAKAYRPMDAAGRRSALRAGLEAYVRGDWFLAHELLEPAWLGTADRVERDLLQGLIKVSAGYVHAVRLNPEGERKNLVGARERLAAEGVAELAETLCPPSGGYPAVDTRWMLGAIDDRLARLAADPARPILDPVPLAPPEAGP